MATKGMQQFVVRGFIYPEENNNKPGFIAVCIDLNLITWRPTYIGAKKSLDQAIQGYIETVIETTSPEEFDQKSLRQLLYRPAPLWPYQVKYYWKKVCNFLKPPNGIPHEGSIIDQNVCLPNPA